MLRRNDKRNVFERHFYKEKRRKLFAITDKSEQNKIICIKKRDGFFPKDTTCEKGYSSLVVMASDIKVNSSMLAIKKLKKYHIISRLNNAPTLPVSCISSTEHVVCMNDSVEDFKSDSEPGTKKEVMFQILVKSNVKTIDVDIEKVSLAKTICENDSLLTENDLTVTFDVNLNLFTVEAGTQLTDIQQVVRNLNQSKRYQLVDCNFENIALNEGICLIKPDASNPIHALANIVDTKTIKGFLERDAGSTTGLFTRSYQDNNWTFNFFHDISDLKKKTGYNNDAHVIKIHRHPSKK
jgi:hypothetical protein